MREAVIVSTARTPIGQAFKGSLNNIKSPTMTAHAIRHAVDRAGRFAKKSATSPAGEAGDYRR